MSNNIKKCVMRFKQSDGTFIEVLPQTNTDNIYRTSDGEILSDVLENIDDKLNEYEMINEEDIEMIMMDIDNE